MNNDTENKKPIPSYDSAETRLFALYLELKYYFSEEMGVYYNHPYREISSARIQACTKIMDFISDELVNIQQNPQQAAQALTDTLSKLQALADTAQLNHQKQFFSFGKSKFNKIAEKIIKRFNSDNINEIYSPKHHYKTNARLEPSDIYLIIQKRFEHELGLTVEKNINNDATTPLIINGQDYVDFFPNYQYATIYKTMQNNQPVYHVLHNITSDKFSTEGITHTALPLDHVASVVNTELNANYNNGTVKKYYTLGRMFDTGPLKKREHYVSINQIDPNSTTLTVINSQPELRISNPDTDKLNELLKDDEGAGNHSVNTTVLNTWTQPFNDWDCGHQVIENHMLSAQGGTRDDYGIMGKITINQKTVERNLSYLYQENVKNQCKQYKENPKNFQKSDQLAKIWTSIWKAKRNRFSNRDVALASVAKDSILKKIHYILYYQTENLPITSTKIPCVSDAHLLAIHKHLNDWLKKNKWHIGRLNIKGLSHARAIYSELNRFKDTVEVLIFEKAYTSQDLAKNQNQTKILDAEDFDSNPMPKNNDDSSEITQDNQEQQEIFAHHTALKKFMQSFKIYLQNNITETNNSHRLSKVYAVIQDIDFDSPSITINQVARLYQRCRNICKHQPFLSNADSVANQFASAFKTTPLINKENHQPVSDFSAFNNLIAINNITLKEKNYDNVLIG